MPDPSRAPWPANATFDERGLVVAGLTATELADRFGTPLLVADEGHLRDRARTFATLFPHPLYAVKAFTSHEMLRLVTEEGLDLLAATGGELHACLAAGIPGSRIVLHGNNKSDDELRLAVTSRVRFVNVDNPWELERLDHVAGEEDVRQPILLRVLPGVGAGAHLAIRTGQRGSKFGIPVAQVPEVVRCAMELPHVDLAGLHAHIGSQVLEVEPYLEAVDVLLDLLADLRHEVGFEADVVDVGGGFGVAYTDEAPLRLDDVAPVLLARVREGAERRGLSVPHTLCEPGRSVSGDGMLTLYRVGTIKPAADGPTLVAVDGGMSDNIRPMLYGARSTIALAGPPRPDARAALVDVVGRHCESGDVLARDVELSAEPEPGELLAVAGTGAYTYSMASTYNRVGRPPVVAVHDGEARPWLRREDDADLERLETGSAVPVDVPVPDGILVRPAVPGDAEGFLELYRSVAAEGRFIRTERVSATARDLRRRFRSSWTEREASIVAVARGEIVGSLSVQREEHPVTRHVATFGMHVASGWRGRGIGAALVAEAIRWAREVQVEKLELSVYPHNAVAIALCRRFGFVQEGRLLRHSKKSHGDEDEILMGMWLGDVP